MPEQPWIMTCAGTLGDHVPFIGLAEALRARGSPSILAINAAMTPHAVARGLDVVTFGETFGPQQADTFAWTYDHWCHPHAQAALNPELVPIVAEECRQLATLCRERDTSGLLAPVQTPHGRIAAELAQVDWFSVAVMPASLASDEQAPRDDATRELDVRFSRFFDAIREAVGLAPLAAETRDHLVSDRGLLACSDAFFSPDTDIFPGIAPTGFWWVDQPVGESWSPSDTLRAFMSLDPPPLVLSFSSLPLEAPKAVLARYREAAASLGLPLLVISGWAGFQRGSGRDAPAGERLMVVDFAPHPWVFARASAVITHGGIGTIARALQAGRPLLVEPYGNDQLFNALRVVQLGVGAAVHPHRATAHGIARVLADKVLSAPAREQATRIANLLAKERGLERACDWLQRQAAGQNPTV